MCTFLYLSACDARVQEQLNSAQAEVDRAQAEQRALGEKKARVPHFWNLNEDPSLSGMIHHFLDGGRSKREYLLGNARANGELKPDIPIFGIRCAAPCERALMLGAMACSLLFFYESL